MATFTFRNRKLYTHPLFLSAVVLTVCASIGSVLYYNANQEPPTPRIAEPSSASADVVTAVGTVTPTENPDLSFLSGGRIATIGVAVGQHVTKGTVLAGLDTSSLVAARTQALADVSAAEANLALQEADTANTSVNLDEVQQEQDTLVNNAYSKLLSDGLTAVPDSSSYTVSAPVISGRYDGQEGTYKVIVRHGNQVTSSRHDLFTYDVERTGPVEINKNEPTPLGTHGLFISFPDALDDYDDTIWYVTMPNTHNDAYLADYNAYQSAQRTRSTALANARASLTAVSGSTSPSSARIASAMAAVEAAKARLTAANVALQNAVVTAPYDGTVTAIPGSVGDTVAANAPILSLSPDSPLQVEIYLSELDIAKIAQGDSADVTLDAYGDGQVFPATVVSIDKSPKPGGTVSSYKTTLQFVSMDPRVATGMTANVTIHPSRTTL